MATLGVVEEQIPELMGCPILDRLKAFEVDQGVKPTLRHVFRDANGNPLDLSDYLGDSDSTSTSETPKGSAIARVREYLGTGLDGCLDELFEYNVTSSDPYHGIIEVQADDEMTDEAGIYEVNWAIKNAAGQVIAVDRSILSVERSLFAPLPQLKHRLGPPTLREIRMTIRDSVASNLLLDGYEFGAEEIMQSIYRPIDDWNNTPPNIESYTTKNFPYREYWMKAIAAYLYGMAGAFYRRNTQQYSGGGLTKSDLDREQQYVAVASAMMAEWKEFVLGMKRTSNAKLFIGYM
jgi:hypothetical protein